MWTISHLRMPYYLAMVRQNGTELEVRTYLYDLIYIDKGGRTAKHEVRQESPTVTLTEKEMDFIDLGNSSL